MDSFTHIVLLLKAGDQRLLQHVARDADLDAGHWRLPVIYPGQGVAKPHPAYCGLDSSVAAALQQWLQEHTFDPAWLKSCRTIGAQRSPPWHPQTQHCHVIELVLNAAAAHHSGQPASAWCAQQQWLQNWREGKILLNPLARGLMQYGDDFDWATSPQESTIHGLDILPVRSHTLPPASHTNTLLLGDAEQRWLVDPSPANMAERDNLIQRLHEQRLAGIFLTHHHGDHHQQAVALAQHFAVPICCSADTRQRIPQRFGADYWQGCQPEVIASGETLCHWQGHAVRAYAVPGHDAGQLALMPDNRFWMLVGDLIQGIGTVVIAKPEGNMSDYFDSLQWVIEQKPNAIIPSHGQVMGSAYRIEQTLMHRKLREQQVLQLHRQGQDAQTMVANIYADVDKRLWGLARMNIDCHLDKLAAEGRL